MVDDPALTLGVGGHPQLIDGGHVMGETPAAPARVVSQPRGRRLLRDAGSRVAPERRYVFAAADVTP